MPDQQTGILPDYTHGGVSLEERKPDFSRRPLAVSDEKPATKKADAPKEDAPASSAVKPPATQ